MQLDQVSHQGPTFSDHTYHFNAVNIIYAPTMHILRRKTFFKKKVVKLLSFFNINFFFQKSNFTIM